MWNLSQSLFLFNLWESSCSPFKKKKSHYSSIDSLLLIWVYFFQCISGRFYPLICVSIPPPLSYQIDYVVLKVLNLYTLVWAILVLFAILYNFKIILSRSIKMWFLRAIRLKLFAENWHFNWVFLSKERVTHLYLWTCSSVLWFFST